MKKTIYLNMCLLALASIILTAILLTGTFYNLANTRITDEVKNKTAFLARGADYAADRLEYLRSLEPPLHDTHLSIVGQDGAVIFDNQNTLEKMDYLRNRPEITAAFEQGYGEGEHFANTLGVRTYYYALQLADGAVLRLGQTTATAYDVFVSILPLIILAAFLISILCNYLAAGLTRKIAEPINNINFPGEQEDIYEEIVPFVKTITLQKKQIEEQVTALEERKNTINMITENMREGMIILDQQGVILSANKSAAELFHKNFSDYAGRSILAFARDMDLFEGIKKALLGQRIDTALSLDGKTFQVLLSPSFAGETINGVILLFMDITEKANTEKIRREFSANVSHELKTPLTSILGISEMIEMGMVKAPDIDNFIAKIKVETAGLIKMVEDIIKISELDEKKGGNQFEQFRLSPLAAEIAGSLKPAADNKEIILETIGGDFDITANRTMIHELLFNLTDNALKYTEPGGSVKVILSQEDGKTLIEVADTGIGIAPEHIDRIFERFYRVDKSRSKKTGGTGLGLSIVKHIVHYHNGKVEIESKENIGTTVKVVI